MSAPAVRTRTTWGAVQVRLRSWLRRLSTTDGHVLGLWLLTRAGLWIVAGVAGLLFARDGVVPPLLARWEQWDFHHYWGIALYGYGGEPTGVPNEAFFPGLPSLLWLGNQIGIRPVVAGLLISFVAGAIATVALGRLGDLEGGPGTGTRTVLLWLLAPSAVFLAAPYTESLFLGLAIPAWLAARRGRWAAAGVLAAAACTVRVSGVFLVFALLVEWATARDRRTLAGLGWLLLAAVPLAAWMTYLRFLTGDWLAWLHAQQEEWNRSFTMPWEAFLNTWNAAFGGQMSPEFAVMFRAEIVVWLLGLAGTILLLSWRRWGEAAWVGIQVAAFGTSYWLFSVPRASLLWWPLWIVLATVTLRRPRWLVAYLVISVPLAILWAAAYLTGRWAG